MSSTSKTLFAVLIALLTAIALVLVVMPTLAVNGDYGINAGPIWTQGAPVYDPTNTYQPSQTPYTSTPEASSTPA